MGRRRVADFTVPMQRQHVCLVPLAIGYGQYPRAQWGCVYDLPSDAPSIAPILSDHANRLD
jgi:hypothetical protein